MLDKVMMERKEVRKDYDERLAHLEIRMGELQPEYGDSDCYCV